MKGTEDGVEEDVGAGTGDGLPGIHHLLLELVEEGIVFLVFIWLTITSWDLFLASHLNEPELLSGIEFSLMLLFLQGS